MKRLLLYTTTGCGGSSERLATSNPPSYIVIFLLDTTQTAVQLRCYLSAALCYSAVMLETQSMHAVVSNLVKQYRYCSQVLPVHVQQTYRSTGTVHLQIQYYWYLYGCTTIQQIQQIYRYTCNQRVGFIPTARIELPCVVLIGLMPMQLTHVRALYCYLGHTCQYDDRIMNRSCLWQWSVIITLLQL